MIEIRNYCGRGGSIVALKCSVEIEPYYVILMFFEVLILDATSDVCAVDCTKWKEACWEVGREVLTIGKVQIRVVKCQKWEELFRLSRCQKPERRADHVHLKWGRPGCLCWLPKSKTFVKSFLIITEWFSTIWEIVFCCQHLEDGVMFYKLLLINNELNFVSEVSFATNYCCFVD